MGERQTGSPNLAFVPKVAKVRHGKLPGRSEMDNFIKQYPYWSLTIIVLVAAFLWLVLAPWPPELVASWGRKQIFLNALLGGITLGTDRKRVV